MITNNQCAVAHAVAFDGPNLIFTDRKRNLVKQLTPNGKVTAISGNGELNTASGKSPSSSHAKPTGLATEGHTVYVCDTGSQTLRIITPTSALASYLENVQKMFQVFSVHSDKTKYSYTKQFGLDNMAKVQQYFNELVSNIREHVQKPTLNPKGPHGSPAYITVEAVTWVNDTLKELKDLFSNVNEPELTAHYEQEFRSLSILTVDGTFFFEHAWSLCHAVHATICPAADAHNTGDSKEDDKYILHLLHTQKSPLSRPNSFSALCKPPMACQTANSPISPEDLQELQEWQKQYCGGVRQRSVRDISKYDTGTLPSFANVEEMNQTEVTSCRMHFQGEQCGEGKCIRSCKRGASSCPSPVSKGSRPRSQARIRYVCSR